MNEMKQEIIRARFARAPNTKQCDLFFRFHRVVDFNKTSVAVDFGRGKKCWSHRIDSEQKATVF